MNYWNYWKINEATNYIYAPILLLILKNRKTAFLISFLQSNFQYINIPFFFVLKPIALV